MRTIRAIYRGGAFHPSEPVSLPPGATVDVTIPDSDPVTETRIRFRGVIGAFPPEVLDKMEADIDEAFGRVDRASV